MGRVRWNEYQIYSILQKQYQARKTYWQCVQKFCPSEKMHKRKKETPLLFGTLEQKILVQEVMPMPPLVPHRVYVYMLTTLNRQSHTIAPKSSCFSFVFTFEIRITLGAVLAPFLKIVASCRLLGILLLY